MPMLPGKENANYAIARIDLSEQSTHGWQVRLQRRGIKYAKFFSDSACGGSSYALAKARQHRDQLIERLDLDHKDKVRICTKSQRNRSGVVGVSRIKVNAANGTTYHFWQATWSPKAGKRCCVKFSIQRYGENEAFELAIQARSDATNQS